MQSRVACFAGRGISPLRRHGVVCKCPVADGGDAIGIEPPYRVVFWKTARASSEGRDAPVAKEPEKRRARVWGGSNPAAEGNPTAGFDPAENRARLGWGGVSAV